MSVIMQLMIGIIGSIIFIAFTYWFIMSDYIISDINDFKYELFKKKISEGDIDAWKKCNNSGFMAKFIDMEINENDERMKELTEYAEILVIYKDTDISFDYEKITYRLWQLRGKNGLKSKKGLMKKFNALICAKIKSLYSAKYIINKYKGKYKKPVTSEDIERKIINKAYKELK
jgi:hypothetical protein